MWSPRKHVINQRFAWSGQRGGWLLPDALLALSLVAVTLVGTQQALMVTRHVENQRQAALIQARKRRDRALIDWAES